MKSRIKITSIDDQPFHSVDYLNVAGKRQVVFQTLPFLRAETPHLPPPLQLLVFTADLQGREKPAAPDGERRLLGEIVAEDISILSQLGDLPPRDRIGVCLCGDFFSRPGLDRRGGSGDCRHVWLAFRDAARWVCGVAGNHDIFGPGPSEPDFNAFKAEAGVYFLEEDAVELDGMNIGGVSGIVGKLCEVMESRVYRLVRSEGLVMVERLSRIAQCWGCRATKSWVKDRGFMQFLVVNSLGVLEG